MKLSEIKKILTNLQELHFVLENGQQVPTISMLPKSARSTKDL